MESLAYSGSFDSFGIKREQYFAPNAKGETFIEVLLRYGQLFQQSKAEMQNSLFGDVNDIEVARPAPPQTEPWPAIEKLNKERSLVGIYLSAHPLDEFDVVLNHMCNTKCEEINRNADYEALSKRSQITFGGIVTSSVEKIAQKSGKPFGIVTIEDYGSPGELMIFADDWAVWESKLKENYTVYITAKCEERWRGSGRMDIKIQSVTQLYDVKNTMLEKITINLNSDSMTDTMVSEMAAIIDAHPGDTDLYMKVYDVETQSSVLLKSHNHGVNVDRKLLLALDNMDNVEYSIN